MTAMVKMSCELHQLWVKQLDSHNETICFPFWWNHSQTALNQGEKHKIYGNFSCQQLFCFYFKWMEKITNCGIVQLNFLTYFPMVSMYRFLYHLFSRELIKFHFNSTLLFPELEDDSKFMSRIESWLLVDWKAVSRCFPC